MAAGEVFALEGYRTATVRRICAKAGANIASVNYYFGGKAELYAALMRLRFDDTQRDVERELSQAGSAEERLCAFVAVLARRMLGEGGPAWHTTLMAREMIEPTAVLDEVVDRMIRPIWTHLRGIVGELLGPRAGEREKDLAANSVIAQLLFYRHNRPVVERLLPGLRYDQAGIEMLARHVASFSMGGLRSIAHAPRSSGRERMGDGRKGEGSTA